MSSDSKQNSMTATLSFASEGVGYPKLSHTAEARNDVAGKRILQDISFYGFEESFSTAFIQSP